MISLFAGGFPQMCLNKLCINPPGIKTKLHLWGASTIV